MELIALLSLRVSCYSLNTDCSVGIFGLARSIYVQIGVCLFGRMSWFDPCKGPAALP